MGAWVCRATIPFGWTSSATWYPLILLLEQRRKLLTAPQRASMGACPRAAGSTCYCQALTPGAALSMAT